MIEKSIDSKTLLFFSMTRIKYKGLNQKQFDRKLNLL